MIKVTETNNLLATHPEIAAEWHPNKNNELLPSMVTAGSGKKVWWLCSQNHVYDMVIGDRTGSKHFGCPYCSGRRVTTGVNDLASVNPKLAAEWHPTKNILSPTEVFATSNKKVWWLGSCGHEWEANISNRARTSGGGCPICCGKLVVSGINDLLTKQPELAKEWDSEKNKLTPDKVYYNSQKKYWWICSECGKSHEVTPYNKKARCGDCNKGRIEVNNLKNKIPEILQYWDYEKNQLLPEDYHCNSKEIVFWTCPNGHSYRQRIQNLYEYTRIHYKNYCPLCKIPTSKSVKTIHKKKTPTQNKKSSIVTFKKAPIFTGSKIEYYRQLRLEEERLMSCGLAAKIIEYHSSDNIDVQFEDGTIVQKKSYTSFKNGKIGHPDLRIQKRLKKDRIGLTKTMNCGLQASIVSYRKSNDIDVLFENGVLKKHCSYAEFIKGAISDLFYHSGTHQPSFANKYPHLLKEWVYEKNIDISPENISCRSYKKVFWKCFYGHEWETSIYSRARGSLCPICSKRNSSSFSEQAILYYLLKQYPDCLSRDTSAIGMELDIYIPSKKLAIEYDGARWHKNNKNDSKKVHLCKEHNISLIRIREEGLCPILGCKNIIRKCPIENNTLQSAIEELFQYLNISMDVSIDRDTPFIYESYYYTTSQNNLSITHPELAKEWHPTKNGTLTPDRVSYGTRKKMWWLCKKGHEWQASVANRAWGNGCIYCSGQKVISGETDLATTHPELLSEWDYKKNEISPSEISYGTQKKVWWLCPQGHSYLSAIAKKTSGRNCPYCSHKKILIGFNDFKTLCPDIAKDWDVSKNATTPENYSSYSKTKVYWKCENGHEIIEDIANRCRKGGCSECKIQQKNESHLGELGTSKNGETIKIIAYRNHNDIDIEFPDGVCLFHKNYFRFTSGQICHPVNNKYKTNKDNLKNSRIGQTVTTKEGFLATIIDYRSSSDIDVQLDDGTVLLHKRYSSFLDGIIYKSNAQKNKYNPQSAATYLQSMKQKYLGMSNYTKSGHKMTIIDYINKEQVVVLFENGAQKTTRMSSFKTGNVKMCS